MRSALKRIRNSDAYNVNTELDWKSFTVRKGTSGANLKYFRRGFLDG